MSHTEQNELLSLLQQVRDGSDDAAWELVNKYSHHVRRAVRRRLPETLRPKFDSVDFVQLTWLSFFRTSDRTVALARPEQLIGWLVQIATHKVLDEVRKRGLQRYDVSREVSGAHHDAPLDEFHATSREETPSQTARVRESWEKILQECTPTERRILKWRQKGATYDEIAHKVGVSRRSAIRTVERVFREFVT